MLHYYCRGDGMKYNWNVYCLQEKMDKLSSLKEKIESDLKNSNSELERDYFEKALFEIENDILMIETLIKEEFAEATDTKKLLTQYSEIKDRLYTIKCLWPTFKDASDITSTLIINNIDEKKHTLSKEDLVELTYDFFRNALDKRLYGNFMKNFYRNNDHLRFLNSDLNSKMSTCIYPLSFFNEKYVSIKREFTINDLFNLIHEYMHATTQSLNPNHAAESKDAYSEIDSTFSQFVAYDFFKKHLPEYKINLSRYYSHLEFSSYVETLTKLVNLIEFENRNYDISNNKTLRQFSNEVGIVDADLKDIFDDFAYTDSAAIGYIYGLEFYKMYEQDKDKALSQLEKFVMYDSKNPKDYYKYLRGLGIIPNEHMREYHKNINRYARCLSQNKNG